jgi:hypothetical protein
VDETVISVSPGARLWHNRNFNTFWLGQSLSALGDAFALIAMPLLVLQATGSVAQMGLVTGTFGIAQLLAGLVAGALVDKMDRRRLMIVCDLGRLLVYSLIPLGWLLAGPQVWLIYVVTGAGSALGMVFEVAYITAIPNMIDKDQITEANARLQISMGISFVAGPVLAGLVIARFNPSVALGVNAFSFLVSAMSLTVIRLRRMTVADSKGGRAPHHLSELVAGVRFLFNQPLLRAVTILFAVINLVSMGGMDLFIYHLKHDLHQSAGTVGLVLGLASIGAIAGGVLTPILRRRFGFGACWIVGLLGTGIGLAGIGIASSVAAIVLLSVAFVFVNTVMGIANMSLRQEITPDHLLGRVTAAFWTIAGITAPLGAAAATALAAAFGSAAILCGMGLITMALAGVALFTPINHRRPELLYAQAQPAADRSPAALAS